MESESKLLPVASLTKALLPSLPKRNEEGKAGKCYSKSFFGEVDLYLTEQFTHAKLIMKKADHIGQVARIPESGRSTTVFAICSDPIPGKPIKKAYGLNDFWAQVPFSSTASEKTSNSESALDQEHEQLNSLEARFQRLKKKESS
ncbi:hypothetical protein Ancab_011052 [Ancistrocladus abbreviatus]